MKTVPVPPIASPLRELGSAPFSFFPPIVGIEHNEWIFRRATWSEIQVLNTKTSEEISIPRHFVGEVSLVAEPVIIVGLIKEIEYREGAVYPHVRRVIEMPRAVNDSRRPRVQDTPPSGMGPAPVVGIRVEQERRPRGIIGPIAAGLLACMALVTVFRDGAVASRFARSAVHVDLPFTAQDDYESIVARIGPPQRDEWISGTRRLWYPSRSYTLVLAGREHPRYAGAFDASGRVIHTAK
jgi:hypothetical protein